MSDIHFIIRPQSGINFDITPNVMRTSLMGGISGIIASNRTYTSGNVIFSGQNNITIGTSSDGVSQWVRMSVANAAGQTYQPVAMSGSNTSITASTISFGNSNSISHYITNGSLVASFSQSTHAHDYIPTASSTRSAGINTSTISTGGTDLKFSFNSSGGTFSVPKWIATAAQISHSHGDVSTIATAGSVLTVNSASNGLTLAVPAWITTAAGGASWELEGANTAGTTGTAFSTLYLEGGNNITLSGNSNTIKFSVADAAGQTYQPVAFSGSNTSTTASTLSFGNSNNISHYITNGSLVASFSESTHAHSFVNQFNGSSGTISFVTGSGMSTTTNASTITFGLRSDISTAWSGQTTANQSRVLDFNGSSGQISFVTGSGMSTTTNASTLTFGLRSDISTAWSGQTTANQSRVVQINGSSGSISFNTASSLSSSANASGITLGLASNISTAWSGQTTANQSRVVQINGSSGTLTISASDNITVSNDAGTIFIKGASGGGGSWELEGTKTAGTTGTAFSTLFLEGYNNITLSGNSNTIRFSVADAAGQTQQPMYFSASGTSTSSNTLQFGNTNGVSFSLSGGSVVATVKTDYIQTSESGSVYFQNSNGLSWGSTTGASSTSITGNYAAIKNLVLSGTTTGTMATISSGTMTLAGGSNITLSQVGNAVTIIGASGGTGAGGAAIQGSGTYSQNTGTVQFQTGNGATFGLSSDGKMTLSYTVPSGSVYFTNGQNVTWSTTADGISTSVMLTAGGGTGASSDHTHGSLSLSLQSLSGTYSSASNGLTLSLTAINSSNFINTSQSGNLYFTNSYNVSWSSSTSSNSTSIMASIATTYAGTGFTSTSTSGTALEATLNTSGLSMRIPAFGGTGGGAALKGSGTYTQNSGTIEFANSNSITFGLTANQMTASVARGNAYFQDGLGIAFSSSTDGLSTSISGSWAVTATTATSTAGTDLKVTLATSGLSFGIPAWLTTAATGGGFQEQISGNTSGTTAIISSGTLTLAGGNNITLSQVGNAITISGANVGGAQTGISGFGNSETTYSSGTVLLSAYSNLTISSSVNGASQYMRFSIADPMPLGSSTRFAGINTSSSSTGGTDLKFSLNSSGATFSVPAWITTYVAQTYQPVAFSGSNTSTTASTISFGSSNSMHFYITNGSLVGSFVESTHAHSFVNQFNGSSGIISFVTGSGMSTTTNASTLTFGLRSDISTAWSGQTTANQSRVLDFNGSSGQISFVTGSGMSTTTNASTLTFGLRSDISTAWSGQTTANASRVIQINGSSGSFSFATGSSLSSSANASSITWGLASNISTAWSGQTTANQSRVLDFNGSSGQISFVTGSGMSTTTNASTLTFGLRSDISTAWSGQTTANQSRVLDFNGSSGQISFVTGSGMSTTTNASTLTFGLRSDISTAWSGQTTANSARVVQFNGTSGTISLSGASNITVSALNGSTITIYGPANILNSLSIGGNTGTTNSSNITGGGFVIAGGSNITLSQSNNTISIHGGAGGGGVAVADSQTTYTSGTVIISGQANITINTSVNGGSQYIRISGGAGAGESNYIYLYGNTSNLSSTSGNTISLSGGTNITLAQSGGSIKIDGPSGNVYMQNASGISWSTSADAGSTSISGIFNATGSTVTTTSGVDAKMTLNTAGLNLALPIFVTNAYSATSQFSASFLNTGEAHIRQIAASNSSYTSGSIILSGSSNLTVSYNGSSILLSVADAIPLGSSTRSAGINTSISSAHAGSQLAFSANSSGITMSVPAWLTTAYSATSQFSASFLNTGEAHIRQLQASNTTVTAGTIELSASRNISMSGNGSTLSIYGPANILNSLSIGGNTGTTNSSAISGGGFVLAGGSNITLSQNNNSISIHGGGGGAESNYIFLYGNTSNLSSTSGSTISLSAGNNITLAQSGGSIKIEAAAGAGAAISAAGSSQNAGTIVFSNSNSVSFGMNGSTVTASVGRGNAYFQDASGISWSSSVDSLSTSLSAIFNATGTSTSGIAGSTLGMSLGTGGLSLSVPAWITTYDPGVMAISASNTYQETGTVKFSNSNNFTFGLSSNGVMTASHVAATRYQLVGANTAGATSGLIYTGILALSGGNNITLSGNDSTVVISAGAGGGGVAIADTAATITNQTVVFSNSNGISFGLNGSTMTGSHYGMHGWYIIGGNTAGTTTNSQVTQGSLYLQGDNMMTISGNGSTLLFSVNTASLLGTGAADSFMKTSGSSKYVQAWSLVGNNTAGTTTQAISQTLYLSGDNMITISGGTGSVIKFSLNSASLLGTGAAASFVYTSVSSKFPIGWSLGTSTGGSTSGTTTQSISNSLYLVAGSNMNLSGNGSSIVINAIPQGSVYFADIVGFSWTSTTAANATTFALKTA